MADEIRKAAIRTKVLFDLADAVRETAWTAIDRLKKAGFTHDEAATAVVQALNGEDYRLTWFEEDDSDV